MKSFCLALFGILSLLPTLHANAIVNMSVSKSLDMFNASATYAVDSRGSGIYFQGFTGSPTSMGPEIVLTFNYSALAGSTIQSATLNLSSVLTSGGLIPNPTVDSHGNSWGTGTAPTFSSTPYLFVSVAGSSSTQNFGLNGNMNYNLLTYFQHDLEVGNSLAVKVSLADIFKADSPASGSWKNTVVTYNPSQSLSGTLIADSSVEYDPPVPSIPMPEPLTMILSGAGLVSFGILRKKQAKR